MDILTEKGLEDAIAFLEAGNPAQAKMIIDESLQNDLESGELIFTSKCCIFWADALYRLERSQSGLQKGDILLQEWKTFMTFIKQNPPVYEPTVYAACRGIFSLALQNFSQLLNEKDPIQKAEIMRKTGLCYKKLGEFENARMCLSQANSLQQRNAAVIADLADCYALCGDSRAAKLLFREAFYTDFKKIDLDFLDSQLIKRLVEKTEKLGYKGDELKAWIPVYAVLWGVFSSKRTLKAQEVGKLKQEIYCLENEIKDPSRTSSFLVPRLINMYFWLIDYCQTTEDSRLINEILLKIKVTDPNIYNMYIH